jgi:predicted membrane protein
MEERNGDRRERSAAGLVPGLIVAGIGIAFLLHNLNILRIHNIWKFWPLILLAIGFSKLLDARDSGGRTGASVLLIVGGVFLAANLGLLSQIGMYWPVILIVAGILMLLNRTGSGLVAGLRVPANHKFAKADALAIFGGFKRQVTTEDYRGASYVAIFGGGEIDLRRAQIQGDSAEIEVTAVFGGFELRVPATWVVANEVVGIFGGTSDETAQPLPEAPGVKRLVVRGAAVFGGVEIKN